jgi:amino acid transporter
VAVGTVFPEKRRKEETLPSEAYVRKTMPQTLGTFDMTMIFLMAVFFINNPVGTTGAGAVAFIYWILGALTFFLPCVIATAQLGTMFPHEGSLYNWTHKALGSFWSLFAGVSFWVPGVLAMVGSAGIAVTFMQGLNSTWLTEPRQQGVLIVFILVCSSALSIQRFRIVQNIVNVTMLLMLSVVALLGLAALLWLVTGHQAATSFTRGSDWAINPGNYVLFSIVILAYLGADVSMIMGGEMTERKVVSRHLFRGGLLVIVSYMIVTWALLIVEGPHAAALGPFSVIHTIDQVFGKFVGNIASICVIGFCIIFTTLLNSAFARLLMVSGIDRRLPIGLAKLNEHRVPANAIMFQTIVAVMFAAIVFILPYTTDLGNPANLANEMFTVSLSTHTLVWAISISFLFLDLLVLYLRDRRSFHERRIFPMPVLWTCMIVAPIACVLAIVVTLSYSPIPQQIPNSQWWYVVGGLTVICLLCAAIGSMLATSEAAWQDENSEVE